MTAYGINRTEASQRVDSVLKRQTDIANFGLSRDKAMLEARQGAERNTIGAVQASAALQQAGRNPQLEVLQAGAQDPAGIGRLIRNNPQLELYQEALNNPRLAQLLSKNDKGFSEFTDFLKANQQLSMQPFAKQLEAFMLAKQMLNPPVYSSEQPPANAIPYTPSAR